LTLAQRVDPYMGFRFLVEIQGLIVAGFTEVTGLQAETEFEEIKEGGVNDHIHKLPKLTKYPNITLKRGITDSDVLWKWHQEVVSGHFKRKDGFIVLLDSVGDEKWRWFFSDAYPVKWTGPDLKTDSSTVAVETLELAHNGIRKA